MDVAIAGIVDAGRVHERAAVDVQRSLHGADSATPVRPPDEGSSGGAATVELSLASRDLAGAMTTMMKATAYNKANVAVLRTADQMSEELTKLIR